ncbi:hypothetical protein BKA58DRAFT_156128 [Alternaria rosae]|uniref:uncharacterized protein n=1 Tax=Alternaria rosae TaxID=1187941 RepID=UPI001E8DC027|nr:uncharacterized protein BKA58DRAFT_156128 [Alternaria rosae]KAH6872895.1 hypothetical protein BKA58DRAFT_156128 [Alternaria rosae]
MGMGISSLFLFECIAWRWADQVKTVFGTWAYFGGSYGVYSFRSTGFMCSARYHSGKVICITCSMQKGGMRVTIHKLCLSALVTVSFLIDR